MMKRDLINWATTDFSCGPSFFDDSAVAAGQTGYCNVGSQDPIGTERLDLNAMRAVRQSLINDCSFSGWAATFCKRMQKPDDLLALCRASVLTRAHSGQPLVRGQ